ncbi:cobalt transporter CbiM [Ancylobacter polymorphus]|uniref:Cobalt transporter CbiM n=1 Tax=Ancylobacter polymorphus TaxID=223390 RepID=A0A9E6ZYB5_9HYPH|nr:cobalt transporter CbiM [Ancylobacter polymorphus]UOK70905.1 cobalt transporter CbiM [Ancylobacter polymorphus]
MAHIPDGLLSAPVLIGGGLLAAGGVALGLRWLDERMIPRTALLAAAFFAGSLVAVPVGPSSVHLLLAGLMGVMLGPATFLAVLVALLLQTLLFGFGGLTTLGVNTVNIALPGVLCGMALGPVIRSTPRPSLRFAAGAAAGALAVLGTGAMVALALWLSSSDFAPASRVVIATYLPLALVEAFVTGAVVSFLARVQPEALRPVTS